MAHDILNELERKGGTKPSPIMKIKKRTAGGGPALTSHLRKSSHFYCSTDGESLTSISPRLGEAEGTTKKVLMNQNEDMTIGISAKQSDKLKKIVLTRRVQLPK